MTDGPTKPPEDHKSKRPGVAHADTPSETVGLPSVGEGASASHFARDLVGYQAGEDDGEHDPRATSKAGKD